MKYYLFRDKDNESNYNNGKSFHAAGYVDAVYSGTASLSGKDLAVVYLDPFTCTIECAWRSFNDVILFEIDNDEYAEIAKNYRSVQLTLKKPIHKETI